MTFTPINYIRMQRVTAQQMNYIQTQYRNCERIKLVDVLPAILSSLEGEIVYLTSEDKFYGFDGTEWATIGDAKLPLSDETNLLYNSINASKKARFDLSLIADGTTRVYYLPNADGTFALMSQVPVITGDTERAVLYRGADNVSIGSNGDVLIGKTVDQPYIEINKSGTHTGEIIKYNDGLNNYLFNVSKEGKTTTKRLCVFSGADG
jgi:hypothetical protein